MSMLAEKRGKRTYVLQPRGKPLYEDANNFGTKMLEKMGWSKGKGLGPNENGNPDFVHVKYKSDNVGFGFADRNDGWTKHEEDFEGFLKSLSNSAQNSDSDEENGSVPTSGFGFKLENPAQADVTHKLSGESLEEKSKKSRARVHYKKFTRSKDLSLYSEKDLANIFGKKSFNICPRKDLEEKEELKEKDSKGNRMLHTFGVTTISSGTSINDYFKNKRFCMNNTQKITDENAEDTLLSRNQHLEKENVTKPKCKKGSENENVLISIDESPTVSTDETPKKKKKRKIEYQGSEENGRDGLEELFSNNDNSGEEIVKKKSKKTKNIKEEGSCAQTFLEDDLQKIKKKKRRKNRSDLEDGEIVGQVEAIKQNIDQNVKNEKNVEKSDEKIMEQIENQEEHDINSIEIVQDGLECEPKKLKRKKHKKAKDVDVDSVPNTHAIVVNVENNLTEQDENAGNQNCEVDQQIETEVRSDHSVKKSKRKKHKKTMADGQDITVAKDAIKCSTKEHEKNKELEQTTSTRPEEVHHSNIDESSTTTQSQESNVCKKNGAEFQSISSEKDVLLNSTVSDKCVFKLSAFCAEIFRHTDINGFEESNLSTIVGYGLSENISVVVECNRNCENQIAEMWCDVIKKRKQLERNKGSKNKKNISLKRLANKRVFVL